MSTDVTILLREFALGDSDALGRLITILYPDLKKIASHRMRSERLNHTLQPSALVSELFLEVAKCRSIDWRDRTHFLAVASQMMRRFLIDHARSHNSERRGGGAATIQYRDIGFQSDGVVDLLVFDSLLNQLALEDPRVAQAVEMRCYGGLTHAEIAEALKIDERTAKRDWQMGRAWMKARLRARSAVAG